MQFSKTRYVTFCQQLLVTACVLATAVAAAGVVSLDIVAPAPDARSVEPAVTVGDAYVNTAPVTPKVRQVAFHGIDRSQPTRQRPTRDGLRLAVVSPAEKATGLATVGVTWNEAERLSDDQVQVDVRTRKAGRWSTWSALEYHDDHGPDASESEGRTERAGTEPTVVGHVQSVQVRAWTATGRAPRGIKVAVIDPGVGHMEREAPAIDTAALDQPKSRTAQPTGQPTGQAEPASSDIALSAMAVSPKPEIFSRAQWGANEKLRDQSAPSYGTIKTGFVHHTVNANNYPKDDVPKLLRSIYAYHVEARGWRDIGYNFLVDRFGRIWEGRWGGVDKAVVGAHTLGYNEVAFAMSAIGNFEEVQPPEAVLEAYAKLFAWKLSKYDIKADATKLWVKDRYLQGINGHRDVGQTACPGKYLYAQIPKIRQMAASIQKGTASTPTPSPTPTPKPTPTPTPPTVPPVGPPITPQSANELPARSDVLGSPWPDLFVRDKATGKVLVVPTGGQAGFTSKVQTAGAWTSYDAIVAPGDLNGDGKGDLFVRNRETHGAKVLLGNGAGGFTTTIGRSAAYTGYSWLTAAGDFDRDGTADLVARDSQKRLVLLPGTGRGTFGKPVVIAASWAYHRPYGVGDFNQDGTPDLVASSDEGTLRLFPGERTSLGTPRVLPVSMAGVDALLGGGDYNADRLPDLVLRHGDTRTIEVLPGTGTGTVSHALGPFPYLRNWSAVTGGQLLGNGGADAIVVLGDKLAIITGNGRTNVSEPVASNLTLPDTGKLMNVGDWDGDGHADLATRGPGGDNIWLWRGDGQGGFKPHTLLGSGFEEFGRIAAVGDVTTDGKPDLVGKEPGGMMTVFPGNGDTGLKSRFRAPTRLRAYNQIGTSLWDATRAPESLLVSTDGTYVPYGGADAAAALAKTADTTYDWVVGPGDVDGDRVPDLLAREQSTGYLWLVPGTTSGTGLGARRFVGAGFQDYDLGG